MTAPILVFAGPSLPPALRPAGPFEWRPPARAGDILALVERPPETVCLIDGYFDWCPAPWHKELLSLMARGTRLLGASSMGALRAAELDGFGMTGIGAIYRAYRDGRITGDDEVALIHATEKLDWAPLSVPMIELRATLAAACRAGLVAIACARRLRARGRELHFEDRDWPALERAFTADRLIDPLVFARLRTMHVPLKRMDAIACLDAALRPDVRRRAIPPPPQTCFMRDLAAELGLPATMSAPDAPIPAPGRSPRRNGGRCPPEAGGGAAPRP